MKSSGPSILARESERPAAADEQELFERAFRHAGVGMALVDLNGRWMKVNDALCRIVGYSRAELLAIDFQTITHPDDLDSDLTSVQRLLSGQIESYDLEKRYLRKDGATVWILLTATLVRTASGTPRFFISQIQDITRRKQAESEIEAFFAASPDLLAIIGKNGVLELCNAAWQQALGWSTEELSAQPLIAFVHPDDVAKTRAERESLRYVPSTGPGVASGPCPERPTFRNRYRTKSGDYRWFEWNTRPLPGDRLYCVARDVTLRVQTEKFQSWLASLVESTSEAVIGVDPAGIILSWNAGAEELYGYRAEEMLGKTNAVLIPEGSENEVFARLSGAPDGPAVYQFDVVRRRKDGRLIDVSITAARVHSDDGQALGWSIIGRDVTEDRRRSDSLARQAEIYAAIARSLPNGSVCMFDRELNYVAAEGPDLFASMQMSAQSFVGRRVGEASTAENREALLRACQDALLGMTSEHEMTARGRSLLVRTAPVNAANGHIVGGVILSLDINDRIVQSRELERVKLLLEATFSNIRDGVALLDSKRQILLANAAYEELLALPSGSAVGMGRDELMAHVESLVDDPQSVRDVLLPTPIGGTERTSVFPLHKPVRRWIRRVITPIDHGSDRLFLIVWRDITAERDLIAEREREVLTDVLTGIPNRRAAESVLRRELARVTRRVAPACVAMLDIDHFKRVNDQHGHTMGDEVLRQVAHLLAKLARGTDLVARWGGEEFVAVLAGELGGAVVFCERVRQAVAAASFAHGAVVTISVGVTACAPGETEGDIVTRADRALYEAKALGRNRVVMLP